MALASQVSFPFNFRLKMIKLTKKQIAVIPITDPDKIGHIYIPDIAKQRVDNGVVKYIGPDVQEIRIGDHVLFSGYTGTLVTIEGEGALIIMHEQDVMCRLFDDPPTMMFTLDDLKHFTEELKAKTTSLDNPASVETFCESLLQIAYAHIYAEGFRF